MENSKSTVYDLVVIGAGPGGYTAAAEAARAGLSVALIEKQQLGGTCLNRGCIPTKALLKSAEVIRTVKQAADFGVEVGLNSLNWSKAVARKDGVVGQLAKGIEQLLKTSGVELIYGEASFVSENEITVSVFFAPTEDNFKFQNSNFKSISFCHCIIAAGSRPQKLNIPGTELPTVYTSDNVMNIEQCPASIAIIGGGVIGMELATIFNEFGANVTVIEYLPQILNGVDSDIVKRLLPMLKKQGITVVTGAKVERIVNDNAVTQVEYIDKTGNKQLIADIVLQATGRIMVEGLNLIAAQIQTERGWISTDMYYQTSNPRVFAIGDINGECLLAHAAEHQAHCAVKSILQNMQSRVQSSELHQQNSGFRTQDSKLIIPSAIFIHPEVAYVGLTEEQCKQKHYDYVIGKALFGANGKAVASAEPEGMAKIIVDRTNRQIIGAHIFGAQAACLIAELVLAMTMRLQIDRIVDSVHAHPTLPEVVVTAARDALTKLVGAD
ncbi:MAG: dihydrolipoyl dehydrogenase [Negativicutes bacterium]|jgi:dihydrolipoamide dehydrogenase